jgi:antitoxin MazE
VATAVSTQLKEWGTSRAVRIPKAICDELGISIGSPITIEYHSDLMGGYIVLRPVLDQHRSYSDAPYRSMDELFDGYEGSYVPTEGDWGEDVGAEVVA